MSMKAVVVYVSEETVRKLDMRVSVLRHLAAAANQDPGRITRASVMRDHVEVVAASTEVAVQELQEAIPYVREGLRT